MSIYLRSFEKASDLDARVSAFTNPAQSLEWNTAKMPWMRFISNVRYEGKMLPHGIISGGSAKILDDLYDTSNRNVPNPGLMDASIKHKGSLGSLKQVVVNYKCWNISQLENLEKAFMSLGKTVVFEYGWSIKPSGERVTGLLSLDSCAQSFSSFFDTTAKTSLNNQGCYAAEKGVVSNFSWNMNADGSYDCTTTFVTPSEMVMGKKTSKTTDDISCVVSKNADDSESATKETDLSRKLSQIVDGEVFLENKLFKKEGKPAGTTIRMDKELTEEESEGVSSIRKFFGGSSLVIPQKYFSWSFFEESILNDAMMDKSEQPTDTDKISKRLKDSICQSGYRLPINCVTRFDCRATKIQNIPDKYTSADPTVCLLPGQFVWDMFGYDGNKEDFTKMNGLDAYAKQAPFDATNGEGWLGNILLNAAFVRKVVLETETVDELVNKVLAGINDACGNHWDFVLMPMEENASVMTVVDSKALGDAVEPYRMSIFGNSSICRNVNVDTKVSNAIKSQIMYGSNKSMGDGPDDEEFSIFGKGLTDATDHWNNFTNKPTIKCEPDSDDKPTKEVSKLDETLWDSIEDLLDSVGPETVSAVKASISSLLNKDKVQVLTNQKPPLLPINLGFTIDGYSGFLWGHSLSVRPLPKRYDDVIFMVTGIDHKISAGSWETTVNTVLRLNANV
mgnify:CR=1 FL=1